MENTRQRDTVISRYQPGPADTGAGDSAALSSDVRAVRVRKKPLVISLVSLGVLLAGAALSLALYGVYGYDRIYNGISCEGVSLSGLTRQEASVLLNESVLNVRYPNSTLKVKIDNQTLEFGSENTGAQVVLSTTAEQLAEKAMQTGREGSFFRRLSFLLGHDEIQLEANTAMSVYIDRSLIFDIVSKTTKELVCRAVPMTVNREENNLIFTRARSGRTIDPVPVTELIVRRLEEMNFSTLNFSLTEVDPVSASLEYVRELFYEAPVNAAVTGDETTGYQIEPHRDGLDVDIEPVRQWLEHGSPEQDTFIVPLVAVPPEVTQQQMEKLLFSDELSRAQTNFSSSTANRKNNVRLAGSLCNETILLPGQQFSFNAAIGPVNTANGYLMAGAYNNGRLVDAIGGGICQVSSTLYNAVLLADLKIVQRNNHSMTVSYLPTGLDAAVGGSSLDFKFENNRKYPVKIRMWTEDNKLNAVIMGTRDNDVTIRMDRVLIYDKPYETVTIVNPLLAPGTSVVTASGHNAVRVETYRVRLDGNGDEISREFEARSTYRMANREIETGPEQSPKETTPDVPVPEQTPAFEPDPEPASEEDNTAE